MQIKWSPDAIADRVAIFDYIEADRPRAAVRVDQQIEDQISLLAHSSEIGRVGRVAGTRELVISQTPYIAAYRILNDTVLVLRVLHGARRWPKECRSNRVHSRANERLAVPMV